MDPLSVVRRVQRVRVRVDELKPRAAHVFFVEHRLACDHMRAWAALGPRGDAAAPDTTAGETSPCEPRHHQSRLTSGARHQTPDTTAGEASPCGRVALR